MAVSIQDVARSANVSVSTVSRSFTKPNMVSAGTRQKVLRIADQLNFSISRSAAALKSGRAMRIALLISDHLRLWFNASVTEGLNEVLQPAGYDLSIFQISGIEDRHEFFSMLPVRRNADAVIVASFGVDSQELARLANVNVPIIGVNCANPRQEGFSAAVNIDDAQGSRLIVRHLIGLGHVSIVYVRTSRAVSLQFSVQRRYEAFVDCCRENGIEPATIVAEDGPDRVGRVLTALMSLPSMPTAVVCQEDAIAVPLLFQLLRAGIRVPAETSVAGFDDGFFAEDIGLTTIRQDPLALARSAGRKALDLIDGGRTDMPFEVMPAELVIRSSTAPRSTNSGSIPL